jgi:DNA-binding LacI/PurR family transcriptional regulator
MANQKEIARLANVSQSVVSRVLSGRNHDRPIAAETIARVREIAAALNYRPNQAARMLLGVESRLIGVIVRSFDDQYLSKVLDELNKRAVPSGYTLLVVGFANGQFDRNEIQLLRNYRPDAFFVIGSTDFSRWDDSFFEPEKPVIQIGVPNTDPRVISCSMDEREAARRIVAHLADLGHKAVGIVGDNSPAARLRTTLLKEALVERGLTCSLPCCFMSERRDRGAGNEAAAYFLDGSVRPHWPSAVIAVEDLIALAFIRCLADAGIEVPRDLSVASYDDIDLAVLFRPSLTTIQQPVRSLAAAGMDMITGTAPRQPVLLPPVLKERESTAAPGA